MLDTIVIEPSVSATATVVWLHGLGASAHDFAGVVPLLSLPEDHAIRFIFPHAPVRPVTINQGMLMPAWYDVLSLENLAQEDVQGIAAAVQQIEEILAAQALPDHRMMVAGFSQGGAVALQMATQRSIPLAGVIALSTYLPGLFSPAQPSLVCRQTATPVMMCHGEYDDVIPHAVGQASFDALTSQGVAADWRSYPVAHTVPLEAFTVLGEWLASRLCSL